MLLSLKNRTISFIRILRKNVVQKSPKFYKYFHFCGKGKNTQKIGFFPAMIAF